MSPVEIILTVITAAGGSAIVVAGLAAWLGKVWADRIAQNQRLHADIDVDLRKRRIRVYRELWSATSRLPKWPKASGLTYEQLLTFSETLRDWYFMKGGMYFSRSTHDKAYSPPSGRPRRGTQRKKLRRSLGRRLREDQKVLQHSAQRSCRRYRVAERRTRVTGL